MDAGRTVLLMAEELLNSKQSFLVETTLSGNSYLRMMKRTKEFGFVVALFFVGTSDFSINMRRVRYRVSRGGHDVPEEDQSRRFPRSMSNFRLAWLLAHEAAVYDDSSNLGPVLLAVKSSAGVVLFAELPDWARFLAEARREF